MLESIFKIQKKKNPGVVYLVNNQLKDLIPQGQETCQPNNNNNVLFAFTYYIFDT